MLRSDAETTKPPAYLFRYPSCQRAPKSKNQHRAISLGAPPTLSPSRPTLPSFGEAVSRPITTNPQEQKTRPTPTFFTQPSHTPCFIGNPNKKFPQHKPTNQHLSTTQITQLPRINQESPPKNGGNRNHRRNRGGNRDLGPPNAKTRQKPGPQDRAGDQGGVSAARAGGRVYPP